MEFCNISCHSQIPVPASGSNHSTRLVPAAIGCMVIGREANEANPGLISTFGGQISLTGRNPAKC